MALSSSSAVAQQSTTCPPVRARNAVAVLARAGASSPKGISRPAASGSGEPGTGRRIPGRRGTSLRQPDGDDHVRARRGVRGTRSTTARVARERDRPLEDCREERHLLEAVAAAARVDDLRLQGVEIEARAPAEQHVEVFERHVRHVRGEEAGKGVERGSGRSTPPDAVEIGVELHGDRRAANAVARRLLGINVRRFGV
jgi:hypothetical protein